MEGTIAITDHGWYEFLLSQPKLDEVNFWTPSSYWSFHANAGSPFFFKLKARYNHAICGFAFFTHYAPLPDWFAWDSFQAKNGCPSLEAMRERIWGIRKSINYKGQQGESEIGCILLAQPMFFEKEAWITGPRDWPDPNLRPMKYDLSKGEGQRIWNECLARTSSYESLKEDRTRPYIAEQVFRYGAPQIIQPRLGQGNFRVAVTDAYSRACAVTHEHSLPALEASHIKPFGKEGPNEVSNGILFRADLHRLFDQGYLTITTEYKLEVSPRLKLDYDNGRSYYPLHGNMIAVPRSAEDKPNKEHIIWHNENIYRAA